LNKWAGFTLLELLIVLTIISILCGLAMGGYQPIIHKTRRLDAQTSLLDYHTRMQQCFITTHHYEQCAMQLQLTHAQLSAEGFYHIQALAATDMTYLLEAQGIEIAQQDKACARFTINHLHQRFAYQHDGEINDSCW
jgi:type IV pilus assembly protein PilE